MNDLEFAALKVAALWAFVIAVVVALVLLAVDVFWRINLVFGTYKTLRGFGYGRIDSVRKTKDFFRGGNEGR